MQACDEVTAEIAPSGVHTIKLKCVSPGSHCIWEFSTRRSNVAFASTVGDDDDESTDAAFSTFECSQKKGEPPVRGLLVPRKYPSEVTLQWQNPSRMYGRMVHIKAEVVEHETMLAAFRAAADLRERQSA